MMHNVPTCTWPRTTSSISSADATQTNTPNGRQLRELPLGLVRQQHRRQGLEEAGERRGDRPAERELQVPAFPLVLAGYA